MGKYEAKGTGLSDADKRKKLYSLALVVLAAIVAAAITFGFITREQVTDFVATLGWAVGIVAGVIGMLAAALARNNVEPPQE